MGFYSPATIVKDAQRHGLKMLPADVTRSEWLCTLEPVLGSQFSVLSENSAVERRQNTAHGVSRGLDNGDERAPEGRKNIAVSVQLPVRNALVIPTPERMRGAEESQVCSQLGTRHSQLLQSREGRHSLAQSLPRACRGDESPGKAPRDGNESRRACPEEAKRVEGDGTKFEKDNTIALRLGLRYVRGLREEAAQALVCERQRAPFTSIHDLTRRVPELRKDELTTLAEIGALNAIGGHKSPAAGKTFVIPTPERTRGAEESRSRSQLATRHSQLHRRDALWQVERAVRASGPLLEQNAEPDEASPLQAMNHEERLVADFHGTGLTVGPHPMAYRRAWLNAMGIRRASELRDLPSGRRLRIGGCVITRQRPGTAKGFVFLSLEDETGVANAIVTPDLFHSNRLLLTSERFLAIEGILQNQDNVISVKAERVLPLFVTSAETVSHDFH